MQQTILKQLSKENTPAYVLDIECLKQRVASIKEYLGQRANLEVCYAMKANPFLLKSLDSLVDRFEVCSPGELSICAKSDIAMDKIVLSGVNKGYEDTLTAMKCGVEIFTAESWKHLHLIQKCAAETTRNVKVLIRLTAGNQFGVDKASIREMIEQKEQFPNLHICGIHYYSGTQKKVEKAGTEIKELVAFCKELEQEYGIQIEKLEYGPGLSIDYFGKKDDVDAILQKCAETLTEVDERIHVTIELGRFITADCGNYITQVVDVKQNEGQCYCIVDGGINHVNYYGQVMGVRIPPVRCYQMQNGEYTEVVMEDKASKEDSLCVCGSLCTSADVLIKSIAIKDIKEGDIFVFEKIGAYSITEGIYFFLSRKLPKIYLLENGTLKLVRDAYETYEWNCSNMCREQG